MGKKKVEKNKSGRWRTGFTFCGQDRSHLKLTFGPSLAGVKKLTVQIFGERVFQTEGKADTQAVRQEWLASAGNIKEAIKVAGSAGAE